jgi:hypothetical protein
VAEQARGRERIGQNRKNYSFQAISVLFSAPMIRVTKATAAVLGVHIKIADRAAIRDL